MENWCRKVLFCDTEPLWRPVPGMYCFVIVSQCGELLQVGIVLCLKANVENSCWRVLICDREKVWRNVAGRYWFLIGSQCGVLLQEGIVL